jgi:N-acetylglucosamine-6-sulfatase
MVLNIDLAPSILDFCGARPPRHCHGRSWKALASGESQDWRKSWYYEYNFEDQFPYTPNVRGVRTDDWKYIHYPNGEGRPETQTAELYHLRNDPGETRNLIQAPEAQARLGELKLELARLKREAGAEPDSMPLDPKVRFELPDLKIR